MKKMDYNGGRFGCFTAGDVKHSCSLPKIVYIISPHSLGTRPFARGRRKGSGHHLTFELSPGRNVDLMNQKH